MIRHLERAAAFLLPLFVLAEVNYPHLRPLSQLAVFAALGLLVQLLGEAGRSDTSAWRRVSGLVLTGVAVLVFGYVTVQTEPATAQLWLGGASLGERAGAEVGLDLVMGGLGLLVVLEASRRAVGWALSILGVTFLAYGWLGPHLPAWLLPHRGYGLERLVGQTFLHSQGVFGVALYVMFAYVFLFVVLGAVLEATGATGYIVQTSQRLFRRSAGGPAKVAVLSSGLMGSLSGSAVANTATTGTFTIPMMRSSGFAPHIAAGVEAAASSGGALMPPVMGAGAYMMLEIVQPPVTYLEIIKAALIPAVLYYLSLFLLVHGLARRAGAGSPREGHEGPGGPRKGSSLWRWEGVVFLGGLGGLLALLVLGYSVFRAVSLSLGLVWILAGAHPRTRLGPRELVAAVTAGSRGAIPLVAAGACVGIVIGVVTLTGAGTRLPSLIVPLAQESLLPALLVLMISSLVLGMGLPSAVCYLLLATFVGPALGDLGVVPLAGHLFIFYFGMMSMVTPPVALAAYAAASIADAKILASSLAAFRFALVGFTLPFLFVFRPQLLMLAPAGGAAPGWSVGMATGLAILGILPLAAALSGHLVTPLSGLRRAWLGMSAALALFPGEGPLLQSSHVSVINLAGVAILASVAVAQWGEARRAAAAPEGLG